MRIESMHQQEHNLINQVLERLGADGSDREALLRYLDPEQPEDPALLEGVGKSAYVNFQAKVPQGSSGAGDLMARWLQRKPELCPRLVKALWAVGGPTLLAALPAQFNRRQWQESSVCHGASFGELLGPAAQAALQADGAFRLQNGLMLRELTELSRRDPQLLADAQELWACRGGGARGLLAALYLNAVPEEKPGLLKRLFGGQEGEDKSHEMKNVLSGCLQAALWDLGGKTCTPGQLTDLRRYAEQGDFSKPMPKSLAPALAGVRQVPQDSSMTAVCAFLALERLPLAEGVLSLYLHAVPQLVLPLCFWAAPLEYAQKKLPWLADHLSMKRLFSGNTPFYATAGVFSSLEQLDALWLELLRLLAARNPQAFEAAAKETVSNSNQIVLNRLRQAAPQIVENAVGGAAASKRQQIIDNLASCFSDPVGNQLVIRYLSTGEGLEDLLRKYPVGSVSSWFYNNSLPAYVQLYGNDAFAGRCLAVCACGGLSAAMESAWFRRADKSKAEGMENFLQLAADAGLPLSDRLAAGGLVYQYVYMEKEKNACLDGAARYLSAHRGEFAGELPEIAQNGPVFARYAALTAMDQFPREYREDLLACAGDSSKQVRELLLALYSGHREWAEEIKGLLLSKKAAVREMGLEVLRKWGPEEFRPELEALLQREKSQKLLALCRGLLGLAAPEDGQAEGGAAPATLEEQTAVMLKGGKKRRVQWLFDTPCLPVRKTDGSPASEELLQALLVCCMETWEQNPAESCSPFAGALKQEDLAAFACEILDKWLEAGAQSKQKWVLTFAALYGGSEAAAKLKHQINEWPQNARGAIACDAVYALALSPAPEALLTVDSISRKFKFRQVKAAAGQALGEAAKKLGLSPEELADRIVPDLGFGEDMRRTFDYGPRSFTVSLSPALELEVQDGNGKRLKTMPAPGKNDDAEKAEAASAAFKALKKQLKATASAQKLRLELALSVNRQWSVAAWEKLFVKNPVMHQFAISLIWGVYENGALQETFRYMEDGSFNTRDEEEYTLPEQGSIGLVHPIELSQEELEGWRQQLEDYEVTQSIEQLDRPVFRVTEEEKEQTALERFGGRMLLDLSLSGKLLGLGWYRGSVQDAGGFYDFYREDGELGVELSFSGSFVGGQGDTVTVYDAVFYPAGTVKRGSYVYDEPKKEDLLPLGRVEPRYFSEIVYQLQKATASSSETNPNWKSER